MSSPDDESDDEQGGSNQRWLTARRAVVSLVEMSGRAGAGKRKWSW